MTSPLLALVLSVLQIRTASAVTLASRPPSPAVVAEIAKELARLKKFHEKAGGIQEIEGKIIAETMKWEDKNEAKIAALEVALKPLKAQRAAMCQRINKEVEQAYGIRPDHFSGKLVTEQFVGHTTHWDPKFGEPEIKADANGDFALTHESMNSWGESKTMEAKPSPFQEVGGRTWPDGQIEITLDAFQHSPGFLAAVIAHETVHFEQNITHGRADLLRNHGDKIEAEAFKVMEDNADRVLGLSDGEKSMLATVKEKELEWAKGNPRPFIVRDGPPPTPTVNDLGRPEQTKAKGEEDFGKSLDSIKTGESGNLDEWLKDAGSVSREVAQHNAAHREAVARARREAQEKRDAEKARIREDADRKRRQELQEEADLHARMAAAMGTMAKLAKAVCAQQGRWSTKDAGDYASMCSGFDRDRMGDWQESITDECEQSVVNTAMMCWSQDIAERDTRRTVPGILRRMAAQERADDKKTLTRVYQGMLDVCYNLCADPRSAWTDYDSLCDGMRQAQRIKDKYTRRNESAPTDVWDDVRSNDCGWELWHDILDNGKGMCFGKDDASETQWARWVKGQAGDAKKKYHPPQAPAPRLGGPVRPGGGGGRGGGCPAGCTCSGGTTPSCPANPL